MSLVLQLPPPASGSLTLGQPVVIDRITTDRYGRTVAELHGPAGNVGQILAREGLARIHPRYAHQCAWSR